MKHFENNTAACEKCSYACLTCATTDRICLTCDNHNYSTDFNNVQRAVTPYCGCNDGFYDNLTSYDHYDWSFTCTACTAPCRTCLSSVTDCTSCVGEYRNITAGCACSDGFYSASTTDSCTICPYKCSTCYTNASCSACENLNRVFDSGACLCSPNYYDLGSYRTCLPCPRYCATCNPTTGACLTCINNTNTFRNFSNQC
jgi:proprotein convertase subtilisin/kexin type 5